MLKNPQDCLRAGGCKFEESLTPRSSSGFLTTPRDMERSQHKAPLRLQALPRGSFWHQLHHRSSPLGLKPRAVQSVPRACGPALGLQCGGLPPGPGSLLCAQHPQGQAGHRPAPTSSPSTVSSFPSSRSLPPPPSLPRVWTFRGPCCPCSNPCAPGCSVLSP